MSIENKTKQENRIEELFKDCDNATSVDIRCIYLKELLIKLKNYKKFYGYCYHLKHKPEFMEGKR